MKDAACRLTPLGVLVLALLREGAMHPYEMLRVLRARREDRLVALTNGTFYHTVARLERWDLLAEVGTDRDGNRPERTTYAITPRGRAAVSDWVRDELWRLDRPAEFRVALAEAHNLEPAEVVELLGKRVRLLELERDDHRGGLSDADLHDVPEQVMVEVDRQLALLDADLVWTRRLLDRLTAGDLPWGFDDPAARTRSHHFDREASHA